MELLVKRITKPTNPNYTIGHLYIDGKFFCDTLEPENRLARGEKKVYGKTAIPAGRYHVTQNVYSSSFGSKQPYLSVCHGFVPRLEKVPNFDGILIHIGNFPKDTLACLLVGENKQKGAVLNSKETWKKLMAILMPQKENIYITYTNPT